MAKTDRLASFLEQSERSTSLLGFLHLSNTIYGYRRTGKCEKKRRAAAESDGEHSFYGGRGLNTEVSSANYQQRCGGAVECGETTAGALLLCWQRRRC